MQYNVKYLQCQRECQLYEKSLDHDNFTTDPMQLIQDGSSTYAAHAWSKSNNSICLGQLFTAASKLKSFFITDLTLYTCAHRVVGYIKVPGPIPTL